MYQTLTLSRNARYTKRRVTKRLGYETSVTQNRQTQAQKCVLAVVVRRMLDRWKMRLQGRSQTYAYCNYVV